MCYGPNNLHAEVTYTIDNLLFMHASMHCETTLSIDSLAILPNDINATCNPRAFYYSTNYSI